jgi:hypothetical protein
VDKMPSNSKDYIIVKAGAFVPLLRFLSSDEDEHFYAMEFLSDHIAEIVVLACTEKNYNKWTRSNIFMLSHCLMSQ